MTPSTTATENPRPGSALFDDDARHEILSSKRRRVLLDVLDDQRTPVDLHTLAEVVGTREDGGDAGQEAVEPVAVSLHHNHLPRLTAAGIVEYDPTARRVQSVRDDLSG